MRESGGELKSRRGAGGEGEGGGGRDGRIGRWSRTMLANKNRCGASADTPTNKVVFLFSSAPLIFYFRMKLGPLYVWAGPAERTIHSS